MSERTIQKLVNGFSTQDGAGVKLVRVISRPDVVDFDPFLMLDAFDSTNPADYEKGFPWHPHRGIETITYLIAGRIEHGDSIGNQGVIGAGDCQWMTAGKGILHQEMPKAAPRMLGAQLWLNLPRTDKMTVPSYRDVQSATIPEVRAPGVAVRVLSGNYAGTTGAVRPDYVRMTYFDVELAPGASWFHGLPEADTAFAYLFAGAFQIGDATVRARDAALLSPGDVVRLRAGIEGARFLFVSGKPLREPIAWGGPIVMNTREELAKAFRQLDEGTFLK